jgi:hypothetical protein
MMTMGKTTNAQRAKPDVLAGSPCEVAEVLVVVVLAPGLVVPPTVPALDGPGVVTIVVIVWVAVVVVVVGGRVTVEVEVWVVVEVDVVVTGGTVVVLVLVAVTVVALVTVAVAVVVTVVVVISPAGTGEHPSCDELTFTPADPRGAMTETDPPPLFAT